MSNLILLKEHLYRTRLFRNLVHFKPVFYFLLNLVSLNLVSYIFNSGKSRSWIKK